MGSRYQSAARNRGQRIEVSSSRKMDVSKIQNRMEDLTDGGKVRPGCNGAKAQPGGVDGLSKTLNQGTQQPRNQPKTRLYQLTNNQKPKLLFGDHGYDMMRRKIADRNQECWRSNGEKNELTSKRLQYIKLI